MLKNIIKVSLELPIPLIISVFILYSNSFIFAFKQNKIFRIGLSIGLVFSILFLYEKANLTSKGRELFQLVFLSILSALTLILIVLTFLSYLKKVKFIIRPIYFFISIFLIGALIFKALNPVLTSFFNFIKVNDFQINSEFIANLFGYLFGFCLSILLFFAFSVVLKNISCGLVLFISLITIVIYLLIILGDLVQILLGRRILSMSDYLFSLVKLTNNYANYLFSIIYLIILFLPVICFFKSFYSSEKYTNLAQKRKIKFNNILKRKWAITSFFSILFVALSITVVKYYVEKEVELSPVEHSEIIGDKAVILATQVADGHLHRFSYITKEKIEVRYIVVKKNKSSYGIGLDACDICGVAGYYERDGQVVCRRCDVVMNKSTIGFKGGCNPVPLEYEFKDGKIYIDVNQFEHEQKRFK